MEQILDLVEQYQVWIIFGVALFSLLLLIFIIIQGIVIGKWKKKYYNIMGGKDYKSLEDMLVEHNVKVGKILDNVEGIVDKQKIADKKLENCVQRVGVVRYNAFNDMGSDLSYSVAFLNAKNNGVIMSGIFGRDFCNTYTKPIENGESTYKLTAEEVLALDRAKKSNII
jgi:hypothetical protein